MLAHRARPTALALATALSLTMALGCTPAIDAQLAEAQSLVAEGQPLAALPLLERVLERRPADGAANLLLGQVLIQVGRMRPAAAPLAKAMESERYAVPAGLLLASAQLGEGRPAEALATVDQVLASHPDQPAALRIRATARLQAGDAEAALADAQRLIEVAPDDAQGPLLLGTALSRLGRLDEAEQILGERERAAREAGGAGHAHLCSAFATFLAAGRQDLARAEETWLRCLETNPADAMVLQGATRFFDQRGQGQRSVEILRRAVEAAPDALGIRLGLATRLSAAGDAAEADALLAEFAESSRAPQAWQALALFRGERGDTAGARDAVERGLEAPGEMADALRFLHAGFLIELGEADAAETVIAAIETPDLADLTTARLQLIRGQAAAALDTLEGITARSPTDVRAHYLAGIASQTLGQVDPALRSFETATELEPATTDAAIAAARLNAALGNHAQAIEMAQRHRASRRTAHPETYRLEARSRIASGQPAAAVALLERELERGPGSADPTLWLLLCDGLEASGGADAALARLERERRNGLDLTDPARLPILERYGWLSVRTGQPDRAAKALAEAAARSPESVPLTVLEGVFAAATGDPEKADAAFRRAAERAPEDPLALAHLGRWLAGHGEAEAGLALLEKAETIAPGQHEAAFHSARILTALGRSDDAEARLRAVVTRDPFHAGAANDLAWLLAEERRDLEFALTLARRAVRLQPGDATLDTLGWVLLQSDQLDAALATFEEAITLAPGNPSYRYRLGSTLERLGRVEEARKAYEQALNEPSSPVAEDARSALARLSEGAG